MFMIATFDKMNLSKLIFLQDFSGKGWLNYLPNGELKKMKI